MKQVVSRYTEQPLTRLPWVRLPGARETQVAWRQVHVAPKSAPQHRDFGAGKVGLI